MSNNINKGNMLGIGTILHGTYRIDGYLSSGGFGNTYVATNQFGEKRAIKEFFMRGVNERMEGSTLVSVSNSEQKGTFDSQLKKFKKEALRQHDLNSVHIVKVYDFFEENGTAYYVMDFIDGYNLKDKLEELGHPMPESVVRKILNQLLDALEAAHNAGIWHLDLKPANIMVDKQGVAKLIDFGASKQQRPEGSGATTTNNSTLIAYTPGYAPSEQTNQELKEFGPWTDFYALGATLYTLLTNDKPAGSYNVEHDTTVNKSASLPKIGEVSAEMKKLILWLMQPQKQSRPQTVAEIREYLSEGDETIVGNNVNGDNEGTTILEPSKAGSYNNNDPSESDTLDIEDHKHTTKWEWLIVIAVVIAATIIVVKACGNTGSTNNVPLSMPVDSDSVAVDTMYADTAAVDTADMVSDEWNSESTKKDVSETETQVKEMSKEDSHPIARDIRPRTVSVGRRVTTQYHRWTLVSLELHDDLTIAHWRVTSRTAETGIWNEGKERIIDRNTGRSYRIMDSNGIGTPSNPTYIPYSGQTVTFEDFFPAIANGTKSVDYDMGNRVIRNIQLR